MCESVLALELSNLKVLSAAKCADFLVLSAEGFLHLVLGYHHCFLLLGLAELDRVLKTGNFKVLGSYRLVNLKLGLLLDSFKAGLECADLLLLGEKFLLLGAELPAEVLSGFSIFCLLLGVLQSLHLLDASCDLLLELGVLYLTYNRSVVRFIYCENISTLWAFKFLHMLLVLY